MKILKKIFAFVVLMIFALGCTLMVCAYNPSLTLKLSEALYGPKEEVRVQVKEPKSVEEYTNEALKGYINENPQVPLRWND